MGSGRDKRKKNKGPRPGVGALKTERKNQKREEKEGRREAKKAKDEDNDIDALLARFKLEDEENNKVNIVDDCSPPSARVYASVVPLNDKEIIMFGGEWLDPVEDTMHVYADLYTFNTQTLKWKHIISPRGPLPRTSHQAVVTKSYMYVFGGEFTSRNHDKFRHYNDLWRIDLSTYVWEQVLSTKGVSPSPRSGHRMVTYKNVIVMFGGFYDSGKTTRYYNDVWVFNLDALTWEQKEISSSGPSPRGGCQLALHQETATAFVIGGYSVKKTEKKLASGGKSGHDDDDGEKGIVHDDIWALDLVSWTWQKVKKEGMAPTPRTSFGLAVQTSKAKAILFGGVFDQEGAGDKMYSELFNEAYQFNMNSRRWFPVTVRPPKAKGKAKEEGDASGLDSALTAAASDKNAAAARAATLIQAAFRGYAVRKAYEVYKVGGKVSELLYSPATYGIDWDSKELIRPRARSAPTLFVLKNTLWLWGGMVEIGHTDVVLDDMWCLDLNKLDGWKCMKENSSGDDAFKELSDESDEE
jgi:N-acetylneuraminic acid mutarotase